MNNLGNPGFAGSYANQGNTAALDNAADESFFDVDLSAMLAAIRRNIIWVAAIMGLALALGVVATLLATPRYIANAKVLVEQEAEQIIEGSDLTPTVAAQDIEKFLQTQVDIINSRSLAERVVEAEGLDQDPAFWEAIKIDLPTEDDLQGRYVGAEGLDALRRDKAISQVMENLTAVLPVRSRLISIGFESTDPVMSARLSNAIAENYIASNLDRRFDSSAYAREFLSQQMQDARDNLERSERELNQYSSLAGLIRLPGQGANADQETTLSVTNETLLRLNQEASAATAQRIDAEKAWQNISRQPVLSVPQVLQNNAMQALIQERSRVEAALSQERARHLDEHPSVIALVAQRDRLDAQIQEVGNGIKQSVRTQYETARDLEQALTGEVTRLRGTALSEQERGVEYNLLKREAENNRVIYDTLLERFNELTATAGSNSNNISLVDRAEVPRNPSSPSLPLNLALALLAGLVLAGSVVFLREYFDDVIRAPEDVERKLNVPLLGLVPEVEGDVWYALEDRKSPINEAYHSLVVNLFHTTGSGLPKLLAVTSSQASEGKSTTSNAIARDLARLGKNVLLVDGDLRRPTLHKLLDRRSQPGLTSVLSGQAELSEVIVQAEDPNLSYMTALPMPPDPSLMLGSPMLPALMADLRDRYDVVIIDSPPMLGLSDAVSWATLSDGTLLIVDASKGARGTVKAAMRRLELVGAPLLGAVLTKFDPAATGKNTYYYGNDYYAYGDTEGAKA